MLRCLNPLFYRSQLLQNVPLFFQTSRPFQDMKFKSEFPFKTKNIRHWFPRHMSKGLFQMRTKLKHVDCIIEVHDARIPFSGRNQMLMDSLKGKPHVLLLNKFDLVKLTDSDVAEIHSRYHQEGIQQVHFTCCKDNPHGRVNKSVGKIMQVCLDLIDSSHQYFRAGDSNFNIMVVGIPNVGKSSLINSFRKLYLDRKAAAPVGRSPGLTKHVSFKIQVCDNPTVFLLDTPGVFKAKVGSMDEGMKLAVCNTIHDHIMGPAMVAEYLLFLLNKNGQFTYVDHFSLTEPTDSVQSLLTRIAVTDKQVQTHRYASGTGPAKLQLPNYDYAADKFLMAYREGLLGKFVLDDF
ncbi:mitochondrial ribosome-associated GTPase 1-like [Clavelina lepadiformis]|uniref:mitochondrial ribosome-associated GTPase 1-like n=1 Tax=Clavelina lepadiformis TaxID=159417 RepID=UPI0040429DCE